METIRWAINLLAVSPEVQAKARRELVEVCGDRPVQLTDRSDIHYNEAVSYFLSNFFYASILPLSDAA